MSVTQALKDHMKRGEYKRVYLFYGDETFLIKRYEQAMSAKIVPADAEMMNKDVFVGKETSSEQIIDAASTLPFLNELRLVIVKDSKLFATGKKDETERIFNFVPDIPESTVLIFIETDIDKRNKLVKRVAEAGYAAEFTTPTESELADWVIGVFASHGKKLSKPNAVLLLRTAAHNMEAVQTECDKLIDYKGSETEITAQDIELVCTKALETKVFDLVAAVGNKKTDEALEIFSGLMLMKEQPIMILAMIARQFKLILQAQSLRESGMSQDNIAATLSLRSFAVKEYLKQAGNFSGGILNKAMDSCIRLDLDIKTGKIDGQTALEVLILSTNTSHAV